jgi:deoxycytidylate deaminase/dephospho-CoA kinase
MQEIVGPKPNENYLKSAISKIYGEEDDFIIIGMTGRTGSGCSTAASILRSEKSVIKNSLYNGDSPGDNEQRKEKIIYRHFLAKWEPFLLLQVRSVITSFLLDYEPNFVLENLGTLFEKEKDKSVLIFEKLRNLYVSANASDFRVYEKFYTEDLPSLCEELRSTLGENNFVRLYQKIGKNIRMSGSPFDPNLAEGKFFTIAERLIEIATRLVQERRKEKIKTFIAIDAIRNPLEALLLQDRFSSFFLMAISAPDEDRIRRLRSQNYSEEDIAAIDNVEYTLHDLEDAESYSVQDIQACLQRADLYVSNPDVLAKVNKFQDLANQLIKFVSLIRQPGIITPSAAERCMQIAYTAKLNSGCISRQVGAVVTDQNLSLRSVGWNDVPHGQVPCNLRSRDDLIAGKDTEAYSDFERKNEEYLHHFEQRSIRYIHISEGGRNNAYCFKSEYNALKNDKNQVHTRSLHAEENAFLQISKYGISSVEGGILFTTASPCELCAKKAYQLGIKKIYYIDPYPGIAISHILRGGSKNPELILFSGAIGRAFHKLYSPIVPYKDELNALSL